MAAALICLLLMLPCAALASAAGSIEIRYASEGQAIAGATFSLYRVAEIDAQGRINLVRNDIKYDNEAMPVRRPPRPDNRRGGDRGGRR